MIDSQPALGTLIRTFADRDSEYWCIAVAMPPSPTSDWVVHLEARFVGVDGIERVMKPAAPEYEPLQFDRRPTSQDLHEVIDVFVGDARRWELVETSGLTMQVRKMLKLCAGMMGGLIHDPGLGVMEALPHASHVARVLALGQGPEVSKFASILVGLACGMHPEPPQEWLRSPVGVIATREGLVEGAPLGEAMSASAAAATLGENGRSAIVALVDAGYLDLHPVMGVTRKSVQALLQEREEARRRSRGEA